MSAQVLGLLLAVGLPVVSLAVCWLDERRGGEW